MTRAHILFVTPDKDEQVYDKVYEFNDADERELKDLMRVVYKKVTSLDFLDNSDLMSPPNLNLGIKDIRKFIELLLAEVTPK